MNEKSGFSRRELLFRSLGMGSAGLMASSPALAMCRLTPRQGEGPFYPERDWNRDNDLTRIRAGASRAAGQIIYLRGTVQSPDCAPVPEALVEIWQAAATGKYNHSLDTTSLALDPNFQYWGRARTDQDGKYEFKTIIPGHYPVGGGRYRPPHIHVKVHARGHYSLTTQVYFDPRSYDDPATARLVENLNRGENVPQSLLVRYYPVSGGGETGAREGEFSFTIRPMS